MGARTRRADRLGLTANVAPQGLPHNPTELEQRPPAAANPWRFGYWICVVLTLGYTSKGLAPSEMALADAINNNRK